MNDRRLVLRAGAKLLGLLALATVAFMLLASFGPPRDALTRPADQGRQVSP